MNIRQQAGEELLPVLNRGSNAKGMSDTQFDKRNETVMRLRAEFMSTMLLDDLYFGPKTHAELVRIKGAKKQWHQLFDAERDQLLSVMQEELNYFQE